MKLTFKGKVAVVTGGSGGIGLDVSKKLAKLKIKVLILDIKKPNITTNKFLYFEKVDLSNKNEINQALDNFIKKQKRVDYLINAAGVLWFDKDLGLEKIETSIWDKVFDINLKSMFLVLKKILPSMKKNKFGSIVNISSIDASIDDILTMEPNLFFFMLGKIFFKTRNIDLRLISKTLSQMLVSIFSKPKSLSNHKTPAAFIK